MSRLSDQLTTPRWLLSRTSLIVFGDSVKGPTRSATGRLWKHASPSRCKYCALVDYSNSRGAIDMGLLPDLLPGLPCPRPSLVMTARRDACRSAGLDALWVVGANPLARSPLASTNAFVVVQDLFLTETAQRADVVFPPLPPMRKAGPSPMSAVKCSC